MKKYFVMLVAALICLSLASPVSAEWKQKQGGSASAANWLLANDYCNAFSCQKVYIDSNTATRNGSTIRFAEYWDVDMVMFDAYPPYRSVCQTEAAPGSPSSVRTLSCVYYDKQNRKTGEKIKPSEWMNADPDTEKVISTAAQYAKTSTK